MVYQNQSFLWISEEEWMDIRLCSLSETGSHSRIQCENLSNYIIREGGIDSNLFFINRRGYIVPHLIDLCKKSFGQSTHNYKTIEAWFAIQGYNEIKTGKNNYTSNSLQLIDSRNWEELPNIARRVYLVRTRRTNESNIWNNIMTLVNSIDYNQNLAKALRNRKKTIISGENRKRISLHNYIKLKGGLNPGIHTRLYPLKYDLDIINAAFRLTFFEYIHRIKKLHSPRAKTMRKFFQSHPNKWIALRNPLLPSNDIRFLVMKDEITRNLNDLIKCIISVNIHENGSLCPKDGFRLTKHNCITLKDIDEFYIEIQLNNAEILTEFPVWSVRDAVRAGYFDDFIKNGYFNKIPSTMWELLIERGNGPINPFLMSLFGNSDFRYAFNNSSSSFSHFLPDSKVEFTGDITFPGLMDYDGQSTIFIPDAASNYSEIMGNTEFVNFKIIKNLQLHYLILDIMKMINSTSSHYKTFQMNVFTVFDLLKSKLSKKKKDWYNQLLTRMNCEGLIIFTYQSEPIEGFPYFSEIQNAARLCFNKYKGNIPDLEKIFRDIIFKMKGFQPKIQYSRKEVIKILTLIDFNRKSEYLFVENIFMNFINQFNRNYNRNLS